MTFRPYLPFLKPRWWGWVLLTLFIRLIIILPFPVLVKLSTGLGWMLRLGAGKRKKTIDQNLALCFPEKSDKERVQIRNENFNNMMLMIFEAAIGWWQPKRAQSLLAEVSGLEHIEQANAQNHGVIILASHFLTMEIIGCALAKSFPLSTSYRIGNNPFLETVSLRGRLNSYQFVEPKNNMLGIVRKVREGLNLFFLPDQFHSGKLSTKITFFGHSVYASTLTSELTSLTNAKALFIVFYREKSGYVARFQPPLEGFPSGNETEDTQRFYDLLEAEIRRYPAQYLWAHRRFKNLIDYD